MKENVSVKLVAKKIAVQVSRLALGGAISLAGSSHFGLAENHTSEQCSLAIVTKQAVGSARICDPKTVQSLARNGHVFEQNQLGLVSMLGIGPGYDPQQAQKWFEQAARKGYAPAQVNLGEMYANG